MKGHEKIDKETFKRIFRDHWKKFVEHCPRYEEKGNIIEKMLGCGDPANGYTEYICPDCLEVKRVVFSCKSKFCLSCARAHLEEWISKIEASLFEKIDYMFRNTINIVILGYRSPNSMTFVRIVK